MNTKSHSISDSKEGLFKQLDAPSSSKEIWLWWEQRRLLYNGICVLTAIIAFAAYAFFLTHSGHLSPGEDLIEPIALMAGVIGGPIAWNLAARNRLGQIVDGVELTAGERIWCDCRDGDQWNFWAKNTSVQTTVDADGSVDYDQLIHGFKGGALVATAGDNPELFLVGRFLENYTPPGTGKLRFFCNDGFPGDRTFAVGGGRIDAFADNSGAITVRVVVTRQK